MRDKTEKTMLEHNMLPAKSVLIALSGGADSVALLHIMCCLAKKHKFKVYSAHVNHGLRGDAALRDELFSKELSERFGVECFVLRRDIRKISKEQGISEELAGRKIRYDFFKKLMHEHNIEFTATAHHKNDNAETIIMNFMRGSSISGLCGIPYKRDRYIRPLLDVTRYDIEKYCAQNSLDFITDETNFDTVYTRNKIRNILIPHLQSEFNPNIVETVTKNANIISADEEFISLVAETEFKRLVSDNSIQTAELNKLHKAISTRIIRKMIESVCGITDISSAVVENVYEISKKDKTGLFADITSGVRARTEYGNLIVEISQSECEDFSYTLKIGESRFIPELGFTIHSDYALKYEKDVAEYFTPCDNTDEITVRNRQTGDTFIPSGMNGTKSVKDYMINEKIPKSKRNRIGILTFGSDIAWIIGYRRDNRFKFNEKGVKIWISY